MDLMNIAIGGTLGGTAPSSDFSYNMLIDYVRIYQSENYPDLPVKITAPTTAATAPTVGNEAISLYSDTLTDDSVVTNFNPGWGQSGSLAAATDVDAAVGNVLKFTNLNYQGVELNETDVSAQESFHLDLWAAETGKVKVFLVSTDGENSSEMGYTLEVTGGEWNSFDIDLDAFAGVDLARVFQLKFDSQAGVVGDDTGLTNFYMDNMYFSTATPTISACSGHRTDNCCDCAYCQVTKRSRFTATR